MNAPAPPEAGMVGALRGGEPVLPKRSSDWAAHQHRQRKEREIRKRRKKAGRGSGCGQGAVPETERRRRGWGIRWKRKLRAEAKQR